MAESKDSKASDKTSTDGSVTMTTSDETDAMLNLAPDGGWGWIVCLAAFVANFILDGTMFSFGVLLIDLLEHFGDSKGKTAWVGSALVGASMVLGPVVGLLMDRYSCRQITIAGTLISFSGFVASIFAPNIEILIFTYGIVGGIGFCMVYITSIIAVGMYFTRKRALATGIAISGSGIGIFTYGYLCDILLSLYDWRGTILLLAGVLLNCLICGAVYRPLYSKTNVYKTKKVVPSDEKDGCPTSSDDGLLFNDLKKKILPHNFGSAPGLNCKLFGQNLKFSEEYYYDSLSSKKYSSALNVYSANDQITTGYLNPMRRKDIFYSGSIRNLPNHRDDLSLMLYLTKSITDSESSSNCSTNSSAGQDQGCWIFRCTSGRTSSKLKIFKNTHFVILLISCTLWTVQSIAMTYMPDMALFKDIHKEQCALLISIVGISNTFARIVAGFLTDVIHIRSTCIYTSALFVACAVSLTLPWCRDFLQMAICAAVFGYCMGTTVALRTIVLADHLGIDQLTHAFSIVAMFQGVAFTILPPLAGTVYDITGFYLYPFIMVGSMYFVSGVICLPLLRERPRLHSDTRIGIVITEDSIGNTESNETLVDKVI